MIEVRVSLVVFAENDAEADEVLRRIDGLSAAWPSTPVVSVVELSREVAR